MILSSLDDMLSIEPLEMFLPFSRNNDKSCTIELSNDTDDHFAFRIATTSILPFNIQPEKGFVPPRSKCCATITLQAQEKAVHNHRSEEFSVQSSRVDSNLTSMDVTGDMFNENVGKVVDEVNLMVVFEMPPEPKDLQNDIAVASQFLMSEGSVKYQQISAGYPHLNTGEGLLGRSAQELLFAPTVPDALRYEDIHALERILQGSESPGKLNFSLLEFITEGFSDSRKIGSSQIADVYKGILRNGIVAVKRLFKNYTDKKYHQEP
ncbi:hypothetical protein QOZ80_5AG0395580 [Eleusine coracana subsp. coracana]|nr:hypothetical protein QOZ80_5AG0395580 [Eleusine coracana subsp. coracana]